MKALFLLVFLLWSATGAAKTGSGPPCDRPQFPPYPAVGAPVNVLTWREGEPIHALGLSGCGISAWGSTLLVALAGSFQFDGKAQDLLARFGAVSSLRGVQYWSVTDHRWQTMITDSLAVDGTKKEHVRPDFTAAEMQTGQDLYFEQRDNRSSGRVIYRMKVRQSDDQRLLLTLDNVTAVWVFLFPLFGPGDLQSLYVLERLGPDRWGYYSLIGVREGFLNGGSDRASYVNRAMSIYRHIARLPADQNTPIWR